VLVPTSFVPQPYPLFAATLRKVDDPARFELADEEPRLVLGWVGGDVGQTLQALAGGGPSGTVWDGPVFFEETRERAERLAKEVGKADRAAVRSAKIMASLDRVDAWLEARAASTK
jgi:hypothetical protein